MIYTSGVISDIDRKETLEELQDNKLAVVCHKLQLKPTDRLLDIGCGWGTLVTYAAKNFDCDATGVTLSRNQAEFGTKRIADNGVDAAKARILRTDFRNLDKAQKFDKIVSLEMAEVRARVSLSLSLFPARARGPHPAALAVARAARRHPPLQHVPRRRVQPPRGRRHPRLPGRRHPSLVAVRGPRLVRSGARSLSVSSVLRRLTRVGGGTCAGASS